MNNENLERVQEWFRLRYRSGNWIDVSESEELPPYLGFEGMILAQMFKFWFAPEIRRRLSDGRIGVDFELNAAQALLSDKPPIVRLNEEVRGRATLKPGHAPFKVGEPVYAPISDLDRFELLEDEMDFGHFTAIRDARTGGWVSSFMFVYGRAKALSLAIKAVQFLNAAKFSIAGAAKSAAIDTLFSACELAAKANLVLDLHPSTKGKSSHKSISTATHATTRWNEAEKPFVNLFKRLSQERSLARYDDDTALTLPSDEDVAIAQEKIEQLKTRANPIVD